ncbi:MAG: lytic transglycosylase domain-containing protein, partial [Cyclobacteriaceae bacterium]|nr:lytic transglycosylase domain-containing protein [Cyclobacteriaceae bacterium]
MIERNFPLLISILALIIVLGYVRYSNDRMKQLLAESDQSKRMQDGTLVPSEWNGSVPPFTAISYDLPSDLSFAGESVPLEIPDVLERLDRELQINVYLHSNTLFLMKRANRWLPQMQEILRKHNIP